MSANTIHSQKPPAMPADLGTQRTVMAADRTLMAWVRTALSMLSFGFTIYKFLETVGQQSHLVHPHGPRQVGLFLVGLGAVSMILGTASYWATLRDLQKSGAFRLGRPAFWVGLIVSIAGVALFVTILRRAI